MVRDDAEQVHPETTREWRDWLEAHHATSSGVWFISWRTASGREAVGYEESVIEALAFGWVDSTARKLDDDRRMMWFGPRKPTSGWARTNKARVEALEREGRMAPAGRRAVDVAKANGAWELLDDVEALVVPEDLGAALDARPQARLHYDAFPPSARRALLLWVVQAKQPATRATRIAEIVEKAAINQRANEWVPRDKR